MSKLDASMTRFDKSLERLETAVEGVSADGGAPKLRKDIAALKADRTRLAEELDATKTEADRLAVLNERASERVAGAIDGIRRVLAES